jgi:hypothetical protein
VVLKVARNMPTRACIGVMECHLTNSTYLMTGLATNHTHLFVGPRKCTLVLNMNTQGIKEATQSMF